MRTRRISSRELLLLLKWMIEYDLKGMKHAYEEISSFIIYQDQLLRGLQIDRPMSTIIDNPIGDALVMRQYKGEKRMIVACGNRPVLFENTTSDIFGPFHDHVGAYTMDLMVGMNPSVVGDFHRTDLRKIVPCDSFDEIWFEGGGSEGQNMTVSNLLWMLKDGGRVDLLGEVPDEDSESGEFLYWNQLVKKNNRLIVLHRGEHVKRGDVIYSGYLFELAWETGGYR